MPAAVLGPPPGSKRNDNHDGLCHEHTRADPGPPGPDDGGLPARPAPLAGRGPQRRGSASPALAAELLRLLRGAVVPAPGHRRSRPLDRPAARRRHRSAGPGPVRGAAAAAARSPGPRPQRRAEPRERQHHLAAHRGDPGGRRPPAEAGADGTGGEGGRRPGARYHRRRHRLAAGRAPAACAQPGRGDRHRPPGHLVHDRHLHDDRHRAVGLVRVNPLLPARSAH